MGMTWRQYAQQVLRGVAVEFLRLPVEERTEGRLTRMIHAAYPYGSLRNHPYTIWLDERHELMAEFGYRTSKHAAAAEQSRDEQIAAGQLELVNE